jgi:hypothetical protein
MRSFHGFAAVVLAVLVCAPAASAQQVDPEFTKARQARTEAIAKGDKATFDRLSAAHFTATGPTGTLETREQRVGRADRAIGGGGGGRGGGRGPGGGLEEERIAVYGDTVVLNWKQGNNRFMEVWVKEGGTWKVAGVQITPVQQQQRQQ